MFKKLTISTSWDRSDSRVQSLDSISLLDHTRLQSESRKEATLSYQNCFADPTDNADIDWFFMVRIVACPTSLSAFLMLSGITNRFINSCGKGLGWTGQVSKSRLDRWASEKLGFGGRRSHNSYLHSSFLPSTFGQEWQRSLRQGARHKPANARKGKGLSKVASSTLSSMLCTRTITTASFMALSFIFIRNPKRKVGVPV